MGDSLTIIIAIFLAAVLMFVFPLSGIAERNDDASQMYIQTTLDEFVNKVASKGTLTKDDYDKLEAQLLSTNNSYDIELTINVADVNPGKKTDNQQIGDTTYYSLYTAQIIDILNANSVYYLKEGDYIKVSLKQINESISQQIKSALFGAGSQTTKITAESGAISSATGRTASY